MSVRRRYPTTSSVVRHLEEKILICNAVLTSLPPTGVEGPSPLESAALRVRAETIARLRALGVDVADDGSSF